MDRKKITILLGVFAALGAIVAALNYIHDRKIKDSLLRLEHELKLLEIEKAKTSLAKDKNKLSMG